MNAAPASQMFYLVDETQSAELLEFRGAMRAMASISGNHVDENPERVDIERTDLADLWSTMEKRLDGIMNGYDTKSVAIQADGTAGRVKI
ncbi:MAG: hypothetical protein WA908_01505 [Pontixanthobacter sp.]